LHPRRAIDAYLLEAQRVQGSALLSPNSIEGPGLHDSPHEILPSPLANGHGVREPETLPDPPTLYDPSHPLRHAHLPNIGPVESPDLRNAAHAGRPGGHWLCTLHHAQAVTGPNHAAQWTITHIP
jgi:hypothetical protein